MYISIYIYLCIYIYSISTYLYLFICTIYIYAAVSNENGKRKPRQFSFLFTVCSTKEVCRLSVCLQRNKRSYSCICSRTKRTKRTVRTCPFMQNFNMYCTYVTLSDALSYCCEDLQDLHRRLFSPLSRDGIEVCTLYSIVCTCFG